MMNSTNLKGFVLNAGASLFVLAFRQVFSELEGVVLRLMEGNIPLLGTLMSSKLRSRIGKLTENRKKIWKTVRFS